MAKFVPAQHYVGPHMAKYVPAQPYVGPNEANKWQNMSQHNPMWGQRRPNLCPHNSYMQLVHVAGGQNGGLKMHSVLISDVAVK